MKKKPIYTFIFLFLMLFCACQNFSKSREKKLPIDTVAAIVADCYFLESEIYLKQWKYDVKDYSLMKYDSFFVKRGVTKEMFVYNVRYYFTHEKYATQIMDKVDEMVEQRVATLRDSLNLEP